MKSINNRYSTFCSLTLTLLSIVGSILALTACQSSDANRPAAPSFVLSNGKIYVMYTNATGIVNNSLAVFRADTGKFLWQGSDILYAPMSDATTVYVSTDTALVARDADSGKERWHSSEALVPRAIINGIVYARVAVNASAISLTALQATDGTRLWTTTLSHAFGGFDIKQIDVEQDRVYVLTDINFSVLQASTGKIIWSSPARASTRVNDIVYLNRWQNTGDSVIDAVQAKDGKLLWSFHAPASTRIPDATTSTATSDGVLCVNTVDALYGLNIKNGSLLWSRPGKAIGDFANPILTANGVLYIASSDEGLLAVQARDGTEHWKFYPNGSISSSLNLDSTQGILYETIIPLSPIYVAAVQTNGQLLWKFQPQNTDAQFQVANGIVYQLQASGIAGSFNEKQHYTQIDLTATRGSDGKSLWSTHFSL